MGNPLWGRISIKPLGANMTQLTIMDADLYFSYETLVAANIGGQCAKTGVKHSSTTTRHITKFGAGMWPPHPNLEEWVYDLLKGMKL